MGVLQLLGFYYVGQDVLTQNFYEQRICPALGWTEVFYEVPLNMFLREGDNSFPLPPRQGGGVESSWQISLNHFIILEMAYDVLREF